MSTCYVGIRQCVGHIECISEEAFDDFCLQGVYSLTWGESHQLDKCPHGDEKIMGKTVKDKEKLKQEFITGLSDLKDKDKRFS